MTSTMRMRQFDALRALAAVYKHGNFTRAAEALDVSTASLSRWILQLEESKGILLINRNTRSLSFTGAGELYASNVVRILDSLEETETLIAAKSSKPHGTLRIASPTDFAKAVLVRTIASFRTAHKEVNVELFLEDGEYNLIERGYDVGIIPISSTRFASLIARPLVRDEVVLCAAPAYVTTRGTPMHPDELKAHDLLATRGGDFDLSFASFQRDDERVQLRTTPAFVTTDIDVLRDAALSGMGIGAFPLTLVRKHLYEGRLIRVVPEFTLPSSGYQAVYASRAFLPAKVRTFIDHLVSNLQSHLIP